VEETKLSIYQQLPRQLLHDSKYVKLHFYFYLLGWWQNQELFLLHSIVKNLYFLLYWWTVWWVLHVIT